MTDTIRDRHMKILVLCEFSGVVREAFRRKGHDAWSCDMLAAKDGSPYHYKMDMFACLAETGPWDIIIAHPPCTYLAVSGNRWYGKGKPSHHKRLEALDMTARLWAAIKKSARVGAALENPVGVLPHAIGPATQYIQPWQFGHGETKKTGLWLDRLPPLQPTNVVEGREQRIWKMGPSEERGYLRSITYKGIAEALAEQWG